MRDHDVKSFEALQKLLTKMTASVNEMTDRYNDTVDSALEELAGLTRSVRELGEKLLEESDKQARILTKLKREDGWAFDKVMTSSPMLKKLAKDQEHAEAGYLEHEPDADPLDLPLAPGKERFEAATKRLTAAVRQTSAELHALQNAVQWKLQPTAEWFDHNLDKHFLWEKDRNPMWLERGSFSVLALKPQGRCLELCSGDGFNTYYFYSIHTKEIVAVDFDPVAVEHARTEHAHDNIRYEIMDIRKELPRGTFDNVIWDAAIEHFTEDEIIDLVKNIKKRLGRHGVLSGYTIVEQDNPGKMLRQHEYEFKSKEDLARFLVPYFKNVRIFETRYDVRHNLYFYASDGVIPFDPRWPMQTHIAR